MENKILNEYEYLNCKLEELKDMLWLLEEDCFVQKMDKLDKWELKDKFRTAQIMTRSVSSLLNYVLKESNEVIDKIYSERKETKEGVA